MESCSRYTSTVLYRLSRTMQLYTTFLDGFAMRYVSRIAEYRRVFKELDSTFYTDFLLSFYFSILEISIIIFNTLLPFGRHYKEKIVAELSLGYPLHSYHIRSLFSYFTHKGISHFHLCPLFHYQKLS